MMGILLLGSLRDTTTATTAQEACDVATATKDRYPAWISLL
jgi:hypothetical protein